MTPRHHEAVERYVREARRRANWIGVTTRRDFFSDELEFVPTLHPRIDTEYFEWIDLLEAVLSAKRQFTMIELGAGYGRWVVNAADAVRSYNALPCRLVAVEPEPTHFLWLRQHLRDNGIRRFGRIRCRTVRAAVEGRKGSVLFAAGNAREWYGQAIVDPGERGGVIRVPAITLSAILRRLRTVDLIHVDIQGAELRVLSEAAPQLDRIVRRVHIGTHSPQIEDGLRVLFGRLAWTSVHDFATGRENDTPWGSMTFQDGVQTWINPRLQ